MTDKPALEEQAISEAVEVSLLTQLDQVENIEVDVRTNLLKMIQGKVDSVSIAGQGLVIEKDIRVHEMEVYTDRIAINPLNAIVGKIDLNHPVQAIVRLVLTEQDINHALNSDYVRSKLQPLELNVEGESVTFELQQLNVELPGGCKIKFNGTTLLHESGKTRRVRFMAAIRVPNSLQPLVLESFDCTQGGGISLKLAIALLTKIEELMSLPYFDWDTMAFQLQSLELNQGSLTVYTSVYVRQLPESPSF
ncbi:MAG TPA: DUF2993 domain-containing protein [Cyanophyceae cyanobacterium]